MIRLLSPAAEYRGLFMERTTSSSASPQRNAKRQGSASTRRIQESSGSELNIIPMRRQGGQGADTSIPGRNTGINKPRTSASLRRARRRQKRRRLFLSLAFSGVLLLAAGALAITAYIRGRVVREYTAVVGSVIHTSDLLCYQADKQKNPLPLPLSTSSPGDYPVEITLGTFTYSVMVHVRENNANGTLLSTNGSPGISDAGPNQLPPAGDTPQDTAAADSQTPQPALPSDTEAPVVLADDIFVTAGSTVSYKKAIRFYDNLDGVNELTLDVDNHGVDLNTVGDYLYTATVTDRSGNTATADAVVHVLAAGSPVADIDEVNALADQVLASILDDSMTPKERLRAIYDWIQDTMHYEGDSQEEDVVLAAYTGFTEHTGNCFTYMAQAKFLLTQAGFDNLVITKVVPEGRTDISTHYWNIVNIGEGWYHYDCTPRRNRRDFFYITDAELKEYSDQHANYGTHVYDPSLYPKIE